MLLAGAKQMISILLISILFYQKFENIVVEP